jgi:hypothetical protein
VVLTCHPDEPLRQQVNYYKPYSRLRRPPLESERYGAGKANHITRGDGSHDCRGQRRQQRRLGRRSYHAVYLPAYAMAYVANRELALDRRSQN